MNDPLIDKPLKIRRPVEQLSGRVRPLGCRPLAGTEVRGLTAGGDGFEPGPAVNRTAAGRTTVVIAAW
jgi:hypothetical protein